MTKLKVTLAVFAFLLSVPAARATTYYLSPSPAGNDGNNGSVGSPWLTPNHAVNCGDQIVAAASSSYSESNFFAGKWGAVTGSGHCVAWLTCATFDGCKIISTNGYGMFVSAAHWGVMGWEVSASPGQAICFEAFPPTSGASIQDVVFANDIANGCYGAAFQPTQNGNAGVDYFVLIADIAYKASQQTSACSSGIDIYGPVQTDSEPGTHIFISQTFSWANVDPNPCAGGPPTDGVGVIFDTWDLFGYAAQGAIENNISFFNGASGYRIDVTTQAPVFVVNNTSYGNNSGPGLNASWCGEIITQSSANVTAEKNIAVTNTADGCGSWPNYAYYLAAWSGANTFNYNLGYSAAGYNDGSNDPSGFVYGTNNVFGVNPVFAGAPASVPPAPNCGGYTSVITCMAPIIADFTATAAAAAGLGRQPVSNTSVNDPLFPSWLCPYSSMLSGLVTMGCGASSTPPAITSAPSTTFTVGVAGTFSVTATGTPAPTLSESGALPSGVTFTAAGMLSGTPAAGTSGTYPITLTAQNGVGTNATQSFTLTVVPATVAPVITSAPSASFTVGVAGTFSVTATGTPTPTLSESGPLPSGVTFAATGVLSGTPAAGTGGTYLITFTAQNGVGTNATQSFTLTVIQGQSSCTPVTPPSGKYFTDLTFSSFNVSANLTRTLNVAPSPACTTTAATYIETTATGQHGANQSYTGSIPNGTAITGTMYVTNDSGSRYLDVVIFDQSFTHYGAIFGINPTTCSTTQSVFSDSGTSHWTLPGTPLKLTQVTVGGVTWCQIQISVIPESSATGLNFYLNYDTSSTGGGGTYAGNGTSGMKFWGAGI